MVKKIIANKDNLVNKESTSKKSIVASKNTVKKTTNIDNKKIIANINKNIKKYWR